MGGEPVMAWGSAITLLRLRLLPALLSQAALSLSVAMFHYYDGKDLSQVSTSLRTWSLAMP